MSGITQVFKETACNHHISQLAPLLNGENQVPTIREQLRRALDEVRLIASTILA